MEKKQECFISTGFGGYGSNAVSGTLRASGADITGGEVLIVTYQEHTGTISPGAHAGGYNGQDAYNDMLITNGHNNNNTQFVPHDSDERQGGTGGIGLQRSADSAENRGGQRDGEDG